MDKHLKEVLDKIEDGIDKLNRKYPHAKKPKIKSGLRGPRYFIEFPITGHKVDAFGLILATEKLIQGAKTTQGGKILSTDSYSQGDNVSYMIDYQVNSTTADGAKSKGSVYIRGLKGEQGIDSFKFVLEKNVDFNDLDADLMLSAIEFLYKMQPAEEEQYEERPKPQKRF